MAASEHLTRRSFLGNSLMAGAAGVAAAHLSTALAADAKAPAWRIGCYTRPWDKQEYRVAFDNIAEAGFKHVGLMTTKSKTRLVISMSTELDEATKIGEEAKKRGLRISSVYAGGIPVNSLKAGIEGMRKLIDNCAAAKAETLLMGGVGGGAAYDIYYNAIAECCDFAAEKRVGITIKPHGGANATGPQCRKIVERVGHKSFTLWYDPGNVYYYSDGKLDPVEDAATVDGLVTGMCVKDYKHPKNVMVTPGDGQVDFPAVMARLKKGGFTSGPMVIETLAAGTVAEAKKGREFLEKLLS